MGNYEGLSQDALEHMLCRLNAYMHSYTCFLTLLIFPLERQLAAAFGIEIRF